MNDGMSAAEAAAELGISRATLYAYVSRGMIRSSSDDGGLRTRSYSAADVRTLKQRQETRRDPVKAAEGVLDWGTPIRESALTLIEDGCLYYRGKDAVRLAQDLSVEQAAALLWLGSEDESARLFAHEPATLRPAARDLIAAIPGALAFDRFQVALPLLAMEDLEAYDLRAEHVAVSGARLLKRMVLLATDSSAAAPGASIAETLARSWQRRLSVGSELLSAALVYCTLRGVGRIVALCRGDRGACGSDGKKARRKCRARRGAVSGVRRRGECSRHRGPALATRR
jgi:citrate synthase